MIFTTTQVFHTSGHTFSLHLVGCTGSEVQARTLELLDYMEIAERADYLPALLSGGEQQRLAVARALVNKPRLILADEPTASLDTVRGKKVMEILKKIAHEQQTTVIAVTHDARMIEGFDHVYHLRDGQLSQAH
ncbi:MAG: ATP-binding cassette domain-containing protein [Candidatus Brocadiaceae bacterium]|nr:ATP-binding cassette domain-containing protein [Candidatus Brocadiaceae bacterium]